MQTTKPGFRLPLAARIFLVCGGLITAAILAAVAVTYSQGQKIAQASVESVLGTSVGVQDAQKQSQLEQIQTLVSFIAQDPAVVQYFASSTDTATQEGLFGDSEVVDPLSVDPLATGSVSLSDLLSERQEQYGFALGIFLDDQGNVLARTDEQEAVQESLRDDAFLQPAIGEVQSLSGFWRQGEMLYQAAITPVQRDEDLLGFLLLAQAVDQTFAKRIGEVSGAHIAYVFPGSPVKVVSSSLSADQNAQLSEALTPDSVAGKAIETAQGIEQLELSLGNSKWIGRLRPVDADAGPHLGSALLLTSADRAYAGFQRILNLVLAAGLGSLVLALPLSFLLAKATLKPVHQLAVAAEEAADGNYQTRVAVGGTDDLARLSRSFDRLLSDLREKSDIEGYVSNLSRFLPEPKSERSTPSGGLSTAARTRPPTLATRILLGVECRALAKPFARDQVPQRAKDMNDFVGAIDLAGKQSDAQLLAQTGSRAILGFAGEDPLERALRAASYLRRDSALADNLSGSLAFALHEGDVLEGQLVVGGSTSPVSSGGTVYQLDRLLSESSEGGVLVARPMAEAVKTAIHAEARAQNGLISGRPFFSLPVDLLDGLARLTPSLTGHTAGAETVVTPQAQGAVTRRQDDFAIGSVFGGRYEILSELGAGGMGVVYKARDLELDDVVALKMLRGAGLMDEESLERLKIEIKLARKITHPNVLRTFDFGEVNGRPYISMEYVRGMTLRYLLKQAGRIPFSAGLRIAKQLCAGLAAAHEVGVLHRDIKPENLILEQSGNAKLMDFGIARPARRSEPGATRQGMFVGTPHYASPEQLAGDEVDFRADVYSTGVLLCEMFCGRLPFNGTNTMEIYMAQMQQSPIRPSEYWPEIPDDLESIILKCIAKSADDRYQNVNDLGMALSRLRA